MADVSWKTRGKYRALTYSDVESPVLLDALFRLPDLLQGKEVRILQAGRHVTYRLPLPVAQGRTIDAVVKRFGRQSFLKDLWDRLMGSKALRSYAASDYLHGAKVGTIPPVACVESWQGLRLRESYFVSLYLDDTVCFKDELVGLWRRGATYREFHDLMELVAEGIRSLHEAGCLHNDLGNQNIQLTRSVPGGPFTGVAFLDHNRARLGVSPSHSARARDLARLVWPSGFFPEFFRLYWRGEPPADFLSAYHRHWLRFRIHSRTRRSRHPIREIRYKVHPETAPAQADYPSLRDQWIWDDEREEPAKTLSDRDFRRMIGAPLLRQGSRTMKEMEKGARALLRSGPGEASRKAGYRLWVEISSADDVDRLLPLARERGVTRVLAVVHGGEAKERLAERLAAVRRLSGEGLRVALLLVQTRDLMRRPGAWREWAGRILRETDGFVEWISCGAGGNTCRWGLVGEEDLRTLFALPDQGASLLAPAVVAPVVQEAIGPYRDALRNGRSRFTGQALVVSEELTRDGKAVRAEVAAMRYVASLPVFLLVRGSLPASLLDDLRSIDGVAEVSSRL